ncbi:hypothetical protein V1478_013474 [Vespula squamosa]|uniref:Uncharacterized protein n=1 Tax=Vespula squamosa TaxID=30214 RepID=A0ABD2AAZ5_VESSQ
MANLVNVRDNGAWFKRRSTFDGPNVDAFVAFEEVSPPVVRRKKVQMQFIAAPTIGDDEVYTPVVMDFLKTFLITSNTEGKFQNALDIIGTPEFSNVSKENTPTRKRVRVCYGPAPSRLGQVGTGSGANAGELTRVQLDRAFSSKIHPIVRYFRSPLYLYKKEKHGESISEDVRVRKYGAGGGTSRRCCFRVPGIPCGGVNAGTATVWYQQVATQMDGFEFRWKIPVYI